KVHERRKRREAEVRGEGHREGAVGRVTRRVRELVDPNHRELLERIASLTGEDLDTFGIDSPSLRSSFDFAGVNRLPSGGSSTDVIWVERVELARRASAQLQQHELGGHPPSALSSSAVLVPTPITSSTRDA